jgi:hypothetical protein
MVVFNQNCLKIAPLEEKKKNGGHLLTIVNEAFFPSTPLIYVH